MEIAIITFCILIRICSNSFLNMFQKILTNNGESSSIVNLYTYLGLSILSVLICQIPIFSFEILKLFFIIGFLGCVGNYYIIKALSCGEMSSLAPINTYKPIIAMIFGILLLNEIPTLYDILGLLIIIVGTLILTNITKIPLKPCLYRILALTFSATEAIFIKKLILISDLKSSFFYWSLSGLLFSIFLSLLSRHKITIKRSSIKFQIYLILMVAIMQYSTNFIFSSMNVASALALFQLSTILSIFIGINLFKEKDLLKKVIASVIMIIGATLIILY